MCGKGTEKTWIQRLRECGTQNLFPFSKSDLSEQCLISSCFYHCQFRLINSTYSFFSLNLENKQTNEQTKWTTVTLHWLSVPYRTCLFRSPLHERHHFLLCVSQITAGPSLLFSSETTYWFNPSYRLSVYFKKQFNTGLLNKALVILYL